MQNHNILHSIQILLICTLITSCAATKVPSGWLPEAEKSSMNIFGGWVEVKLSKGQIIGELISLTDDTMFVVKDSLYAIVVTDILKARLVTYNASSLGGNAFFGTLSTLSNGVLLIFTAPMWIIGGSIAAISRSFDPIIDYPNKPLKQFLPFARYPQGFPPGLDRTKIKMKGTK